MPLTVVIGSSGSGKTTFLDDVHKLNDCCYIRQYHALRPYVPVAKIPKFDPTKLPYWNLYADKELVAGGSKNASYDPDVKIGGDMAGETIKGLSGGQRKLMIFELVNQRVAHQKRGLLICLDEPFCGVTDDFVPFIIERLNIMRKTHNILLVTNDHIKELTGMADHTITVSAQERNTITVDGKLYDREIALYAVAQGEGYEHSADSADLMFFASTELLTNPQVGAVLMFTVFTMGLFTLSYWDSKPSTGPLIIIAVQIVCFFAVQPFLVALSDWRNITIAESEALMHNSVQMNLALKSVVTLLLLIATSAIAFGCLNLVTSEFTSVDIWISMLFDGFSLGAPWVCFGLYTKLPLQQVTILSSMPFLFMIFFSTTFSPGAGVEGVKEIRWLFSRFYFWCQIDGVKEFMEGCPADEDLVLYTVLSGCLGLFIFIVVMGGLFLKERYRDIVEDDKRAAISAKPEFMQLHDLFTNTALFAAVSNV